MVLLAVAPPPTAAGVVDWVLVIFSCWGVFSSSSEVPSMLPDLDPLLVIPPPPVAEEVAVCCSPPSPFTFTLLLLVVFP